MALAEPRAASLLALDIRRVTYTDGCVALRDVALSIAAGEILGVVGHVGAGKSTLALVAAGLLPRSIAGTIDGSVRGAARGGAHPAYVFANPWTQLTELGGTVEEEVAVGPENMGVPSAEIRARVDRALARADATALAARLPYQLSGGECQRVALASALAMETPVLVLDEPTAQLDPEATARFAVALRALAAEGHGVLLVEQNLDLVRELASRVLVLADGAVVAQGDPAALLDRWPPIDARLGAPGAIERRHAPARDSRSTAEPILLSVVRVAAGYPGARDVLDDVSLSVARGSAVAWLGRNGAGKSTLARAIMGLIPTRRGSIRVGDVTLDPLPVEARARHVGLVFQDPGRQLFSRTVIEETLFGPRTLGMSAGAARDSAREALDAVGLGAAGRLHPGDLAPQSQRRLAIAAAMASRPALLILDEPTAGQDAEGRAHIARALEMQCARGAAAVITHDLPFAHRHCDDAITLDGGRVRAHAGARS